ncbi:DUF397 domain-containing protein [Streptomyces niveiscabiei]|uniref:DUF397 domain-containing protein n=1 Tax=Streptomyces niveiscabiei TaxID=164115 RepID=UPI0029AC6BB1|nr:DUF397 domain-containing protein [Streptomyces niveiscabiei]MDX3383099.1 DUF397 domain-containing protein [Streptomyces niveiscabiei]
MAQASGPRWIKSSYTGEGGNNCVEIAVLDHHIAVRDSKIPARTFTLTRAAFTALVRSL